MTRIARSRTPPDSQSANLKPQGSDPIELPLQVGEYLGRPRSPATIAAAAAIPLPVQVPSANATEDERNSGG